MRLKTVSLVLLIGIGTALFAQDAKSRSEFFKEFYGTYLKPLDIEVDMPEDTSALAADLKPLILQYEKRHSIDIPAEDEAAFKTAEDVNNWVRKYLEAQPAEQPFVEEAAEAKTPSGKTKKERRSWKVKLYGSFGPVEPGGINDSSQFNGNLFGSGAFTQFRQMNTFEAGLAFHPYGFNGKDKRSHKSWGLSFDYARFDHPKDTDTSFASRWGLNLNFQQDLTGRKKVRPVAGIYFMESLHWGLHSFQKKNYPNIDNTLQFWNHHYAGIGLAQGIYFSIFDLKFYQRVSYSFDKYGYSPTAVYEALPFMKKLYFETGLRLSVALKL